MKRHCILAAAGISLLLAAPAVALEQDVVERCSASRVSPPGGGHPCYHIRVVFLNLSGHELRIGKAKVMASPDGQLDMWMEDIGFHPVKTAHPGQEVTLEFELGGEHGFAITRGVFLVIGFGCGDRLVAGPYWAILPPVSDIPDVRDSAAGVGIRLNSFPERKEGGSADGDRIAIYHNRVIVDFPAARAFAQGFLAEGEAIPQDRVRIWSDVEGHIAGQS